LYVLLAASICVSKNLMNNVTSQYELSNKNTNLRKHKSIIFSLKAVVEKQMYV